MADFEKWYKINEIIIEAHYYYSLYHQLPLSWNNIWNCTLVRGRKQRRGDWNRSEEKTLKRRYNKKPG